MKTYTRLIISLFLFGYYSIANGNQQSEFDEFVRSQQRAFDTFVAQNDREFLRMLDEQWQEFQAMPGLQRDAKPKPQSPWNVDSTAQKNSIIQLSPEKRKQSLAAQQNTQSDQQNASFYGHNLSFPDFSVRPLTSMEQRSLRDFWQANGALVDSTLLPQLSYYRESLPLSDWGYFLLLKHYVAQSGLSDADGMALIWLLLNRSGIQAKIAVGNNGLVLLVASQITVYDVPYYSIYGERFYQLAGDLSATIKTYSGQYTDASNALDMRILPMPTAETDIRYRALTFRQDNKQYTLRVPYDLHRIDYLNTYPQLDLVHYFNSQVDHITANALVTQIEPLLSGTNDDKINQLLNFVHQTIPYRVDEQQFGEENYLLVEESLHYAAADCEDRSVFFAWLVNQFVDEAIVGLDYPGHVSTGLVRNGDVLVADPTYIGASLGEIMPQYQQVEPTVIRIDR